jgi:hypothetical protein
MARPALTILYPQSSILASSSSEQSAVKFWELAAEFVDQECGIKSRGKSLPFLRIKGSTESGPIR